MDSYGIALFIHLLAILSAAGASTLVHLAESRIARATTARDALEWHRFAGLTARVFPLAVVVLVATGGLMVTAQHRWAWDLGWVRAGVIGAVLLMTFGAVIGVRSKRVAAALAQGRLAAALDPVARTLGWTNSCLALGIVFAMAVKPGMAGSLGGLAAFAALGATIGARRSGLLKASGAVALARE